MVSRNASVDDTAGNITALRPIAELDAWQVARYLSGGPTPDLDQLQSDIARDAVRAMMDGTDRDAALNAYLDSLPADARSALRHQVVAADPNSDPPGQAATVSPDEETQVQYPSLPDGVLLHPDQSEGAGGWVDTYTEHALAISPMTPRLFHQSAALALAATAIARRLRLEMPFGSIFPNLFGLWVAPTTLWRKTTALNFTRDIARRAFPHLMAPQEFTPEALISDLAGSTPSNWEEMSLEAQKAWNAERNFAAQRGLILDEMSGLLSSVGRDYNAGLVEALLKLYDCEPEYTRSTRGQGRITIRNAYLCLLGASTPRALSLHLNEGRLWDMGWWPRFAILTPNASRPKWSVPVHREEPASLVGDLVRLYGRLPTPTYPQPPPARTISLGTGVYGAWEKYSKAVSYDLLSDSVDSRLWGNYGRLPTQALKIATILAALDWTDTVVPQIELPHLSRAIEIAETWRESAHRALISARRDDADALRDRLLQTIARFHPKGATRRDLSRAIRDRKPTELDRALLELIKAGEVESTGVESTGGRPTERYRIVTG